MNILKRVFLLLVVVLVAIVSIAAQEATCKSRHQALISDN